MIKYEQLIDKWSKHPDLLSAFEDRNIWVVPTEVLNITAELTDNIVNRVLHSCKAFNTDYAVIRTTQRSDVKWMVDTMPTIRISIDLIPEAISEIKRKILENTDFEWLHTTSEWREYLETYSQSEWNWYISEETQITIGPFIEWNVSVLTRHPNQKEIILNDDLICDRYPQRDPKSFPFRYDNMPLATNWRETMPFSAIEWRWILPSDIAFQIEWIHDRIRNKFWLLQIREFAKKHEAEFIIDSPNNHKIYQGRNFGDTWKEWVVLPLAWITWKDRRFAINDWINFWPRVPWYALSVYDNSVWVSREWYPWNNQVWYFIVNRWKNIALSHNNTRFIQNALRDPQWFAILWDKIWHPDTDYDEKSMSRQLFKMRPKLARFFCNWKDFRIDPIQDNWKFNQFLNDEEMTWDNLIWEVSEN